MPGYRCFVNVMETAVFVGFPVDYYTMKKLAVTGIGSEPMTTL